jgi:anti-anti-sigma factor
MSAVADRWLPADRVVVVEGPLRVPETRWLRRRIRAHLRRGERTIVLDLARVSRIDAAGVGELVRAYNMATRAGGTLRIVHATSWVREILERVGLFGVLSAGESAIRSRITGIAAR